MLIICVFMMSGNIAFTLDHIESTLSSLCKDVDTFKEGCECNTDIKSPQKVSSDPPTLMNKDNKVATRFSWVKGMEFEPSKASYQISSVKVGKSWRRLLGDLHSLEECRQADAKVSVSSS